MSTFTFNPQNPFNLRGFMVQPAPNDAYQINYYVVLLDLPSTVQSSNFDSGTRGADNVTLTYTYSGPPLPNYSDPTKPNYLGVPDVASWKTHALTFTYQGDPGNDSHFNTWPDLTTVQIVEATTPTVVYGRGNPNLRRPPIVDFALASTQSVNGTTPIGIPNALVIQSESNISDYFIMVMVNIGSVGGFNNLITSFTPDPNFNNQLNFSLTPNPALSGMFVSLGVYRCDRDGLANPFSDSNYVLFNRISCSNDLSGLTNSFIDWPVTI